MSLINIRKHSVFQDFIKETSFLTLGNIFVFLISVFVYPVIGRLYSDVSFAEFAIFQSLVIILQKLINLGYNEVVLIINNVFLKQVVKSLYGFALLILPLFYSVSYVVNSFIGYKEQWFMALLSLSVLLSSINDTNATFFLRTGRIRHISILRVMDRSVFSILALIFGAFTMSVNAIIIGFIMGQVASLTGAIRAMFTILKTRIKIRTVKLIASKYVAFPKYSLPSSFVERFSSQLPILLLPFLTGNAVTGQYAMAYKILVIPELLIAASLGQIFYRKAAHLYRIKKPMRSLLLQTWKIQLMIGFIPFFLAIVFGKSLFPLILGEQWSLSGEIAQIIGFSVLLSFVSTPTSSIFSIFGKQQYGLYFSLALLIARFLSLYLGIQWLGLTLALAMVVTLECLIIVIYNYLSYTTISYWEDSFC